MDKFIAGLKMYVVQFLVSLGLYFVAGLFIFAYYFGVGSSGNLGSFNIFNPIWIIALSLISVFSMAYADDCTDEKKSFCMYGIAIVMSLIFNGVFVWVTVLNCIIAYLVGYKLLKKYN